MMQQNTKENKKIWQNFIRCSMYGNWVIKEKPDINGIEKKKI